MFYRSRSNYAASARNLALLAAFTVATTVNAQGSQKVDSSRPANSATPSTSPVAAHVTRASIAQQAPAIDGSDTDGVWKTAMTVDNFRMFQPVENGEPRFRTEAK